MTPTNKSNGQQKQDPLNKNESETLKMKSKLQTGIFIYLFILVCIKFWSTLVKSIENHSGTAVASCMENRAVVQTSGLLLRTCVSAVPMLRNV